MDIYSWEEIRAVGNCIDYVRDVLGKPVKDVTGDWTRFDSPLRPDSDSGAFACKPECWHDHVTKEKGSILDLCAEAQFQGNLFHAAEFLGQHYRLTPKQVTKKARKFVQAYDYHDPETGILLHQTVRWEPKEFSQRRPDPKNPDKWIWNLENIKPVLYRIRAWRHLNWVCIVGGEKDADNLLALKIPATTNPMGEGNWKNHFADWLDGKYIVIIPDNDDPGRSHAYSVARALKDHHIKILHLPDLPEKGDVSDWLDAGHTAAELKKLIKECPITKPEDVAPQKELSDAKIANRKPMANYRVDKIITDSGEPKLGPVPVHINELVDDIFRRFHNFPRRVGGKMFDHDRLSGGIRSFDRSSDLFAWIAEKSGQEVKWNHRLEGAVTQDQLYSSLYYRCQQYQMISGVPNWPTRQDVYYTFGELPAPTEDARYFNEFCSFFCASTELDACILKALVASPIFYRYKVDRPLWIIDSQQGQGVGKTKLAEMVAYLYGGEDPDCGEPLWIHYNEINSEVTMERVLRRLLSATGRKKRIFLLDNVDGYFRSSSLATLITQGSISGLPPYGKGEETRTNDLTYIITSNSATVCRDLASRSFFVILEKPKAPIKTWETQVQQYIRNYRLQIIADIIGILERGPDFDVNPQTRFQVWEQQILAPILGDEETYQDVLELNKDRLSAADGESEEAEQIKEYFIQQMRDKGIDPDTSCVWLEARVIAKWASDCIPGFGGQTGRNARQKLLNMSKAGIIPELSAPIKRYPTGKGKTGMMWNFNSYVRDPTDPHDRVRILYQEADGTISLRSRN